MGSLFPIAFLVGPLVLFSKVSSASQISQSGSFTLPVVIGCEGISYIAPIYSDWWATMHIASGPGVRGPSIKVIAQSIKIIIIARVAIALRGYMLGYLIPPDL